jgi:proteic killer suppression protein
VIRSFRHKGLKRLFAGDPKGVHAAFRNKGGNILGVLDAASSPKDVDLPGFRLHELAGDQAGTWSVTVNKNWHITFRFEDGGAEDVDLLDYH